MVVARGQRVDGVCVFVQASGTVSLLGWATSWGVSTRQAPTSGVAVEPPESPPGVQKQPERVTAANARGATTRQTCGIGPPSPR